MMGASPTIGFPLQTAGSPAAATARTGPQLAVRLYTERGSPFTTTGFARMIERAGKPAKLAFKAHHQYGAAKLPALLGKQRLSP
jgi:hypothetical protein